jgi:hypothetical protein
VATANYKLQAGTKPISELPPKESTVTLPLNRAARKPSNNRVQGNFIATNATGLGALGKERTPSESTLRRKESQVKSLR